MKTYLLIICVLCGSHGLIAQFSDAPQSALSASLSSSGLASIKSEMSMDNLTSMNTNKKTQVHLSHRSTHMLKALSTLNFLAFAPVKQHRFGVQFKRYGNPLYFEQMFSLLYSIQLQPKLTLAFRSDFQKVLIENKAHKLPPTIAIHSMYQLNDWINLAARVYNPSYSSADERPNASIMEFGLALKALPYLSLYADLNQNSLEGPSIQTGLLYEVIDHINLSMGFNSQQFKSSYGIGIDFDSFSTFISAEIHPILGMSSQISMHVSL